MKPNSQDTLIVYYSYSGNNRLLAEYLARDLEADIIPVIEKSPRSWMTILFDVFLNRTPEIEKLPLSMDDYSHIVFLAPIWNEKIANPLKSLLKNEKHKIRDYSFVTLCGGYEKKNQMTKVKKELQDLIGKPPRSLHELDVSDIFPQQEKRKIRTISGYHVSASDLNQYYRDKLREITNSLSSWLHEPRKQSELDSLV